jgi:peroxiredoxin
MQGKRAVIFGVPDMGDVCTNKHVPSFLDQVRETASCMCSMSGRPR